MRREEISDRQKEQRAGARRMGRRKGEEKKERRENLSLFCRLLSIGFILNIKQVSEADNLVYQ